MGVPRAGQGLPSLSVPLPWPGGALECRCRVGRGDRAEPRGVGWGQAELTGISCDLSFCLFF